MRKLLHPSRFRSDGGWVSTIYALCRPPRFERSLGTPQMGVRSVAGCQGAARMLEELEMRVVRMAQVLSSDLGRAILRELGVEG